MPYDFQALAVAGAFDFGTDQQITDRLFGRSPTFTPTFRLSATINFRLSRHTHTRRQARALTAGNTQPKVDKTFFHNAYVENNVEKTLKSGIFKNSPKILNSMHSGKMG